MRVLIMGSPTTNGYQAFGREQKVYGGRWVENLIEQFLISETDIQISVCFYDNLTQCLQVGNFSGVDYYMLPIRVKGLTSCNDKMVEDLRKVFHDASPDIVHIMGTEREHDLKLLQIAGADSTLISVTGMVSYISKHYYAGIAPGNFRKKTIGDYLRNGGPIKEKKWFEQYGEYEKNTIRNAKYVMGRTTWDYACVKQINSQIQYIYCGEILSPVFGEKVWDVKNIARHRIFVSQGSYPLKGLHKLIEAFPMILKAYPDSEIVVAGPNILDDRTLIARIKRTTYAKYIIKLIQKLQIPKDKIRFTGSLKADEMLEQYLYANVYVLPSAIENSPNSLGEAMLLGMPCVASCVGGVQDMVRDKVDGFLYPFDESYMLAHYICEIFKDDEMARKMGAKARESARRRFDTNEVVKITASTYRRIMGKKGYSHE